MTTLDTTDRPRRTAGIDLAGTEWPLYKIDS